MSPQFAVSYADPATGAEHARVPVYADDAPAACELIARSVIAYAHDAGAASFVAVAGVRCRAWPLEADAEPAEVIVRPALAVEVKR